ncbi:MAG: class I SAM-dependent methyltransferase [Calditrichia bacterium]
MQEINPWLTIPAADYEGHMNSPQVDQLSFLSRIFRDVLEKYMPRHLAVIGCTTGNGFEHIDFSVTRQVTAVDINPEYIEVLRHRYSRHLDRIETICADLMDCHPAQHSFDLVHGALIFEYVDPAPALHRIGKWLLPGGRLSVVLQLESAKQGPVSESGYQSVKSVAGIMRLIPPDQFSAIAAAQNFRLESGETETLPSGKEFFKGIYSCGG